MDAGSFTEDGSYVLLTSNDAYEIERMWGEGGTDYYLMNLKTGEKSLIGKKMRGFAQFSPDGKYVAYFEKGAWYTYDIETKKAVNITAKLPTVRWSSEEYDQPDIRPAYGIAGWTNNDDRVLVNTRYDIWELDPRGAAAPKIITDSAGAKQKIVFRPMRFDMEQRSYSPAEPLWLTATNDRTKATGFYRASLGSRKPPEKVVMVEKRFGGLTRAKQAEMYITSLETAEEYPDIWIGPSPTNLTKITDANPQQKEYNWPTAELVHWTGTTGVPLDGILYKPRDFDPKKKYPMVVYYYEILTDRFHGYNAPSGRNVVNPSVYASQGYLVFFPDIKYVPGHPGKSALNSVIPGVNSLIARGYVKANAIGCAGQSWGGYQTAYMITQVNTFKACMAGAPVANMFSAYGGIRWESGLNRSMQYEHTQSRIGATPWQRRDLYIENSPLFFLDRVKTPVLIMHNDNDGAVPWYQGIEMYIGLRRLGKEAYLLNYNGDAHNPGKRGNQRDIDMRMLQFFAHHLKGEPAPEWMVKGVPYARKGRDQPAFPPASTSTTSSSGSH
jgi:dipeptidyl aminopeptidase/acylaminoacyl peptidase